MRKFLFSFFSTLFIVFLSLQSCSPPETTQESNIEKTVATEKGSTETAKENNEKLAEKTKENIAEKSDASLEKDPLPEKCVDQCSKGAKKCTSLGWQECLTQANGCTDWGAENRCWSGQYCDAGKCAGTCSDQCIEGENQCDGDKVKTCQKNNSGCTDWSIPTECSNNGKCNNGQCSGTNPTPSCTDRCGLGSFLCTNTGLRTCVKTSAGCTDWNTETTCPQGLLCSGGQCVKTCVDQCTLGKVRCNGPYAQTCVQLSSGCTDWELPKSCGTNQLCSNDTCIASKCTLGEKKCSGNQIEECDSSGTFQTVQICPQACVSGTCSVSAKCSAGTRQCNGDQVEECNPTGTAWLFVRACQNQCSNGFCSGGCTAGDKRCVNNVPETCKSDGSGWEKQTACSSTCIRGLCREASLLLDNKTVTLDGEIHYENDVVLKNNSKITVGNRGWLRIYAKNILIDSTSSIVAPPKGNDPRGKGHGVATCSAIYCTNQIITTKSGGPGSYGTKATYTSLCCYSSCYSNYANVCKDSDYDGKYWCSISLEGDTYGLAVSNIDTGASGGACSTPNGGGMIDLIASQKVEIQGKSLDNLKVMGGSKADGGNASGCREGSGGGIRIIADEVNLDQSILNADGGGNGAGVGRIKVLYGSKKNIAQIATKGTVEQSIMPPLEISSQTHPQQALWYNDSFSSVSLSWVRPYANVTGYYYKVNQSLPSSATDIPNTQSTYHTGEIVNIPQEQFKQGENYFHILSVGTNAELGKIETAFQINLNTQTLTVTSSSHPDSTKWHTPTTVYLSWSNPVPEKSVKKYYYVFDKYANTIPTKADTALPVADKQVLLANRPTSTIWYFHVLSEDTQGYLTKKAAHFKVQIGPEPGKGGISGDVRESTSSTGIDGVKIILNRGLQETTTSSGGKYFFSNTVYEGSYELRAEKKGYETYVTQINITSGQNTSLDIVMKKTP